MNPNSKFSRYWPETHAFKWLWITYIIGITIWFIGVGFYNLEDHNYGLFKENLIKWFFLISLPLIGLFMFSIFDRIDHMFEKGE